MIPELGNIASIIALCFALILSFAPLLSINNAASSQHTFVRTCAFGCSLFVLISFFSLVYLCYSNDFTVLYVARHCHASLPWIYRIGAVWGGHEGSLLLWITMLAVWLLLLNFWPTQLPARSHSKVLVVFGWLLVGFLLFLCFESNPFARLLTRDPVIGQDLNPLLQDPGLIVHPPMLYLGYVGFAATFAYGIVALWEAKLSQAWLQDCRRWTLIAWCFLGIGIVLGSWWSYRELGWGGWWFWDPVENASLLPWLVATTLLHSLMVSRHKQVFQAWTILLALLSFILSLLGTFLVRSGVLISVHAFSNDPSRGIYLLLFLFIIISGSLLLYAIRAKLLYKAPNFALVSRETILLINNVFLLTITATILLGTLYPIILDSLGLGKISVGAPYFNKVFIPIMLPLLLLMGIAPQTRWQHMSLKNLWHKHWRRFIICLSIALVTPWLFTSHYYAMVVVGLFLACWIMSSISLKGSHLGIKLAHWGVAICLLGITLSSFYNQERSVLMKPGDSVELAGYHFNFAHLAHKTGPNYKTTIANFKIQNSANNTPKTLQSEQRIYTASNERLTKTGIQANIWRDLYLVIGPQMTQGYWTVRLYYKPFIRWIWAGGLLMVLGGVICLFPTVNLRHREAT